MSYETRRKLRQDHGPSGEAVFDVIAHHDTGDGIELSHQKVAGEANVSKIMARRMIDRLCDTGWLKRRFSLSA